MASGGGARASSCVQPPDARQARAGRQGGREAGRQGGREAGRQGGREAGRQGGREAGRQGGRAAGRQGGRAAGRQGGREAGRQGGRAAGPGSQRLARRTYRAVGVGEQPASLLLAQRLQLQHPLALRPTPCSSQRLSPPCTPSAPLPGLPSADRFEFACALSHLVHHRRAHDAHIAPRCASAIAVRAAALYRTPPPPPPRRSSSPIADGAARGLQCRSAARGAAAPARLVAD